LVQAVYDASSGDTVYLGAETFTLTAALELNGVSLSGVAGTIIQVDPSFDQTLAYTTDASTTGAAQPCHDLAANFGSKYPLIFATGSSVTISKVAIVGPYPRPAAQKTQSYGICSNAASFTLTDSSLAAIRPDPIANSDTYPFTAVVVYDGNATINKTTISDFSGSGIVSFSNGKLIVQNSVITGPGSSPAVQRFAGAQLYGYGIQVSAGSALIENNTISDFVVESSVSSPDGAVYLFEYVNPDGSPTYDFLTPPTAVISGNTFDAVDDALLVEGTTNVSAIVSGKSATHITDVTLSARVGGWVEFTNLSAPTVSGDSALVTYDPSGVAVDKPIPSLVMSLTGPSSKSGSPYFAYASATYALGDLTGYAMPTPTAKGYTFLGWYRDAKLTNRFTSADFAGFKITGNTTLYAKWLKIPTPVPSPHHTVDTGGSVASNGAALGLLGVLLICAAVVVLASRRRVVS